MWSARHGFAVFPLVPDSKAPAVRAWESAGSTDPAAVESWPRATTGYGIACGPSHLYVVDLDTPKADTPPPPEAYPEAACGLDVLLLLAAEAGEAMPGDTFTVQTGRGGVHLYYQMPDDVLSNTAGRLGWLIDTRGRGGYVVGPGSTVGGSTYRTVAATPPAPLPAWIARTLTHSTAAAPLDGQTASQGGAGGATVASVVRLAGSPVGPEWPAAALQGEAERIRTAPAGQGNATVNRAAYTIGRLVGAQLLARDDAVRELVAALDTWTWTAPADRARMLRTLERALADGERSPRTIAPREQRRTA